MISLRNSRKGVWHSQSHTGSLDLDFVQAEVLFTSSELRAEAEPVMVDVPLRSLRGCGAVLQSSLRCWTYLPEDAAFIFSEAQFLLAWLCSVGYSVLVLVEKKIKIEPGILVRLLSSTLQEAWLFIPSCVYMHLIFPLVLYLLSGLFHVVRVVGFLFFLSYHFTEKTC